MGAAARLQHLVRRRVSGGFSSVRRERVDRGVGFGGRVRRAAHRRRRAHRRASAVQKAGETASQGATDAAATAVAR